MGTISSFAFFNKKNLWFLLIFLVYSAVFLFSYSTTELPSYEKVPLMDGNQYLKMWHYFKDPGNSGYKIDFPYNGRILYMWLAAMLPFLSDPFQAFILLNYFFGLATLYLLFNIWNKLSVPLFPSLFLLIYLCLHWSGIIRQYMIDPIGVDIPYLFLLVLLLNSIVFKKYKYLFITAIIGTAVKEAILPFLLVLLFLQLYNKKVVFAEHKKIKINRSNVDKDIQYIALALMGSILCKVVINICFPAIQTGWKQSSVVMVAYYFYLLIKDPDHLFNWLTGIVLFFGVFLYPFTKALLTKKNTTGTRGELLFLTLLGILLAILGGGDHTRIAFLSFPFFFTYLLLYSKETPQPFPWFLYVIPSLYLTKCWLSVPTPTSNWEVFSYWYPEYSSYKFFFYELLVVLISIIVLYFYDKIKNGQASIRST